MKKLSVTEAINLYENSLSSLPEISSLHVGFDDNKPAIIVTVEKMTEDLERRIAEIAPNAPIKIIQLTPKKPTNPVDAATSSTKQGQIGTKKQISANEAKSKYGEAIRNLKSVNSVDVGRKSGKTVLMVRAFPLTESTKANIRSVAPNAPLEFKESQYGKTSVHSIFEFLFKKLKYMILLLAVGEILFVILSPLYYATGDIKFAIGASSADGVVVASERPVANAHNSDDITQEVTVKFSARNNIFIFTQEAALFRTLTHMDNMNAEPYHKGASVSVAYDSRDPPGTARIFDRGRFWATIFLYTFAIIFILQMSYRAWRHWQEW